LEKTGTFINHQGMRQRFAAAVNPPGMCRPVEAAIQALVPHPRRAG
ncbi:MAG: hypothetical protein HUU37_11400, partial [Bdellovibrionales bacterium]|nr:hypothetical protein [Bdellovibrionales bacterium]